MKRGPWPGGFSSFRRPDSPACDRDRLRATHIYGAEYRPTARCCSARTSVRAPVPVAVLTIRPEPEDLRGEPALDQKRAECAGEADHGCHEQDGDGFRQARPEKRSREERHDHERDE